MMDPIIMAVNLNVEAMARVLGKSADEVRQNNNIESLLLFIGTLNMYSQETSEQPQQATPKEDVSAAVRDFVERMQNGNAEPGA